MAIQLPFPQPQFPRPHSSPANAVPSGAGRPSPSPAANHLGARHERSRAVGADTRPPEAG